MIHIPKEETIMIELKREALSDKIVNKLIEIISHYDPYEINYKSAKQFIEFVDKKMTVCHGVSKIVFIPPDWDFVIKIPKLYATKQNYCAKEYDNYKNAGELQSILLETDFIYKTLKGLELYAQRRFSVVWEDLPRTNQLQLLAENPYNEHLIIKIINACYDNDTETHPCNILPLEWVGLAVAHYGKKFWRKFEQFTHNRKINDLHEGNVGFAFNRPIIIDYAGYDFENE